MNFALLMCTNCSTFSAAIAQIFGHWGTSGVAKIHIYKRSNGRIFKNLTTPTPCRALWILSGSLDECNSLTVACFWKVTNKVKSTKRTISPPNQAPMFSQQSLRWISLCAAINYLITEGEPLQNIHILLYSDTAETHCILEEAGLNKINMLSEYNFIVDSDFHT